MRIIFFGTPEPAAGLLKTLIDSKHEIICVVTQPDRPQGRGQKVAFSPVKELALKHALPLEQPASVKNNPVFTAQLKSFKPDLCVVAAYGKILPKEILEIPGHGFINVHASLLPKYRGAAPIQWALLKGEAETGVSLFQLVEQLDAGPIVAQKSVRIAEDDNYQTLEKKLFFDAGPLVLEALEKIGRGQAVFAPQKEAEVTFAPSLTKESGEIDWKKGAAEIHNRIRALCVWPVAHTFCRQKRLKLFKSKPNMLNLNRGERLPGTVIEIMKGEGFIVATGSGDLEIIEVQPEGGKIMSAYDFVIGRGLKIGDSLPS